MYKYLIVLLFVVHIAHGQEYIYKHFGVDEGLPSSQVYDIYQDKQGYIWFATDKGLSRYNGYEFENFTTNDGLPDNVILNFFPQKNGQIWCFGYQSQSLFYFDEEFNGFKPYKHNATFKKHINNGSVVKSIVLDENESLHIGGYSILGSIEIKKDGKVIKRFDGDANPENIQEKEDLYIGVDTQKNILFSIFDAYQSTENTLVFKFNNTINPRLQFDILNEKQYIIINDSLRILNKDNSYKNIDIAHTVIGVKRVSDTHFFVGYYNNGAEIRNVSGKVVKTFLPKQSVTNFLIDTRGSYWFSTLDHGVFYVKNPEVQVFTEEYVHSLVKDNENRLYAGFNNGDIVSIYNNTSKIIYKALNTNRAVVGFDTIRNHFYGYSEGNFVNYTTNKKVLANYVRKIPENMGSPLLKTATNSYTMLQNDTVVRYSLDYKVQDVCMYKDEVLLGTSNGLFVHRDSIVNIDESLDFLKLRIDDIDVNTTGNTVYMATHGAGVVVYGNTTYSINEKDGLTNNIVNEVYIENDTTVWACTNSGLNRITFNSDKDFKIATLTKEDGLLSNDIDDVEIINDTIWVATKEGLCFFDKTILDEKKASKIISLSLQNVSTNNQELKGEHIRLANTQNNITFLLQAISHKHTHKIKYHYRLKEIDTNWTTINNRRISFPSLASGTYTFQAKASVKGNYSDRMISYEFKILPPFWRTWWFYSLCALLCTGIIYLFFKIRVLSYNKDIIRELIRLALKRLKRKEKFLQLRSSGEDFKVPTYEILYIKSQGNYIDIVTEKKTYTIRCKIGEFIATTPDKLEYLRVHRSYIIRIDKISSKGKKWVVIKEQKIPVGETYLEQLQMIQF
ncbi:ligand-binding sensor domain-containing protein [Kordia sp.]|uniref:ligand-binding sensor domain-containing protein n=1 Tax=Kordia sp. TaxID=1965332 RepID=UPI003B5BE529